MTGSRSGLKVSEMPAPSPTWTILLAGMGIFMTALDNLVVATALPVLRTNLHAGLSGLEWTLNAYLLAFACLILTGAALGDRFGRRRMYAVGIALFTAASAAAALSPSVGALIAARVVQGAGAAIAFPLTLTLISEAFPVEKRGAAIGMWGAIAGIAVAFGPLIGGAIIKGINWHWIFWINVPVGVTLVALAPRFLSESYGPRPSIDGIGVMLAAAGSLGLTWGLVRANTVGWESFEVLATLTAGAALIAGFLAWERLARSPMLPLELFRHRGFASANAVSFFMYAGLFGALFLMTQLLQSAQGHSPLAAGIRMLPWTAAPGVVSPIAGALADRLGNRPFMIVGLTMQAIGLGWIAAVVTAHIGYAQLGLAFAVAGIGIGMVFPTVANAVLGSVPLAEAGVASGANSTIRELGGVFGVAVMAAVLARRGIYTSPRIFVDGFSPALWVGVGLSALGIGAAALAPGRGAADAVPGLALAEAR
ncbi:MAG: DHA2 family efflux MFS transporter permease subunit [Solirubrobacterales bacterium]|nr:DHA2 family efflux MFS transporter permease subunit [Solirubrobacterales bacterium]